ncbi:MAG: hypothetical protein ACO20N_04070 [bacterium]
MGDLSKAPFRLPLDRTGPSLVAFLELLDLCADKKLKILFKSDQESVTIDPDDAPLCRHGL